MRPSSLLAVLVATPLFACTLTPVAEERHTLGGAGAGGKPAASADHGSLARDAMAEVSAVAATPRPLPIGETHGNISHSSGLTIAPTEPPRIGDRPDRTFDLARKSLYGADAPGGPTGGRARIADAPPTRIGELLTY